MSRWFKIGVCLVVGLVVVGVVTFRIVPTTPEAYWLSAEEVGELEVRARGADGAAAASRLASFYYYAKADVERARYWYGYAADLGDEGAKRALEHLSSP